MEKYLNGKTAGEKGKIRENPGKNGRVDRYTNDTRMCVGFGYMTAIYCGIKICQTLFINFSCSFIRPLQAVLQIIQRESLMAILVLQDI